MSGPQTEAGRALLRRPHRAWPKGDEEWSQTLVIIEREAAEAVMREAVAKGYYKSDIAAFLASPETAEALARLLFAAQLPADNWTWEAIDQTARDEFLRRANFILAAMRETR